MKKLLLIICLVPVMAFANDYTPFKMVGKSGDQISLTFTEKGIRFRVTYKDKEFISSYGQILNINKGDTLILIEKHTKYIITSVENSELNVEYIHNLQGKKTKNIYEIKFK